MSTVRRFMAKARIFCSQNFAILMLVFGGLITAIAMLLGRDVAMRASMGGWGALIVVVVIMGVYFFRRPDLTVTSYSSWVDLPEMVRLRSGAEESITAVDGCLKGLECECCRSHLVYQESANDS